MRKMGALLSAAMLLMLCASLAVVGTYSLFTENVEVKNHLVAGTLELGLVRTAHEKVVCTADGDGVLKKVSVASENVDLTTGDVNVFDLADGDYIAPGSTCTATMKIAGKGSVAFTYSVALRLENGTAAENAELAGKLMVYVNGSTEGKLLSECAGEDGYIVIGAGENTVVRKDASSEFTVRIEFLKDAANEAQGKEVRFDLYVYAEQYVPSEALSD